VKPANNTAKNTSCSTGGSSPAVTCASTGPISAPASGKADASKKYGNGKTAAQIATQNGAAPGAKLYGPGNSQPHKVVTCGHRHGVDVHALKSHPARGCDHSPTPPPNHHTDPPRPNDPHGVTPHGSTSTDGPKPATPTAKHETGTNSGAEVTVVSGVLAGTLAVGHTSLPFTGFPLWAVAIAALVLMGTGLSLRRLARATA